MTKQTFYPSNLNDSEWLIIKSSLSKAKKHKCGRKKEINQREIINAILYIMKEECPWRSLPSDFPHWSTVRTYFDRWKGTKVWYRLNWILQKKLIEESKNDNLIETTK